MELNLHRSSRSRKPKEIYTPSKGQENVGVKRSAKYGLDKNKALAKKLSNTYIEEIRTELKKGTLVITLPTAEFEAFRACVKNLDKANPSLGIKISIDLINDKNNLIVSESVAVKWTNTDKQLYRINLHLTT